jgi:hypothetical protein
MSERMVHPAANGAEPALIAYPVMILLEVSLVVLSIVAFALFDLYARACDKI